MQSTYDNHLRGLENETFVRSPGTAARLLSEAATENVQNLVKIDPGFAFFNDKENYAWFDIK